MKSKRIKVLGFFMLIITQISNSQVLDLYSCLDGAEATMPLLKQESMMDELLNNKLSTYNKAYLPNITAFGQASYQSVVPELPFSIPGSPGLEIPKLQYRAYLEVYQPLFDAGVSRALKTAEVAQSEVSIKMLELSLVQYKKQVSLLYFQMLLADEQLTIVSKGIELMREREKSVESAFLNGVVQQNDLLKLKSEILNQEKRMDELTTSKTSGMEILALLTGIPTEGRSLEMPEMKGTIDYNIVANPELQLIETRKGGLMATENMIKSKRLPQVSAFGQAGLGAPNPYNFFEKDLSPYYIAGVRASWTIWDWGKTSSERKNLNLNQRMLEEQKNQKQIEVESNVNRLRNSDLQLNKALDRDEAIFDLKSQIRKNAEQQLDLGVITPTDYLDEVLAEQVAELTKSVDEIALRQNQILLQFETGALK